MQENLKKEYENKLLKLNSELQEVNDQKLTLEAGGLEAEVGEVMLVVSIVLHSAPSDVYNQCCTLSFKKCRLEILLSLK